jgi:AcrR family transcriptional regulator
MTPPGRRERKKERTRQAIAAAALRQFSAHGFDATTVAAICEEADVAVSTFYVYFDSKEAAAFPDT